MRNYSLKSWKRTPPGGWTYKQPGTGLEMTASDSTTLFQKIKSHREYKRLGRTSIAEITGDVEQQVVQRIKRDPNFVTHKQVVYAND